MDDDIFKWEMEEEAVGEMIADFSLKGEELEESLILYPETHSSNVNAVHIDKSLVHIGDNRSPTGGLPVVHWESSVNSRINLSNPTLCHEPMGHRRFAAQNWHFTGGYDVYPQATDLSQ
ncbi:hypothetical protein HAX54_029321 [Datura stramonium]|uniref:Uncharacterized protein n=1 Tax=Datura stramonium TaxID=4076 RepID=A0ABS8V5Z0_DATST|nr:hypothetical protein [Datura stramonium]